MSCCDDKCIDESKFRSTLFSSALFLKQEDSLAGVIATDVKTLSALGFTMQELANFMDSLHRIYKDHKTKAHEQTMENYRNFSVHYQLSNITYAVDGETKQFSLTGVSYLGCQSCPFGCKIPCGQNCANTTMWIARNHNTVVRQTNDTVLSSDQIQFGNLLPHLAREHSFLESDGLAYRVDPQRWSDFFGLAAIKRTNPDESFLDFFQRDTGVTCKMVCDVESALMRAMKMMSGTGGLVYTH
jgi:hypothetical protein